MLLHPMISPSNKCPNRRWRSVENSYPMLGDNLPKPIRLRLIGRPFVHQRRCPIAQSPIHRVAMPRHPTDIRRTPKQVRLLQIKYQLSRQMSPQQITRRRMQNSLWLSRAPTRVENKKRVFTLQLFRRAVRRLVQHQLMPPAIDFI